MDRARPVDRRTLVRGAAWATPVIAAAAAAPALAASPVACPSFPVTGYTETTSGSLNTAPRGFVGSSYQMSTDANSTSQATVTVTSPAITVTAGTTYTLSVLIQTRYGVNTDGNGPAGTRNTNLTLSAFGSITGSTVTSGPYSTQTGNGGTVITPINGGFSGGSTVTLKFTANANGTVQVRYAFVMAATTRGNNDDYQITSNFTSCSR